MVKEGLIVEARTLVRCCIENLIWIDGLATKGKEFITEVVHDEYKSKMARGKQLLEWVAAQKTQLELGEKLELFLDETKKQFPKAKKINLKASLQAGPLKDLYGFYGVLSADAAHPSASSLSRHIEKPETNVINIGNPEPEEEEVLETLEYGCMAMIGVCVGTNQIIGSLPSGQKLEGLFQEYTKLQQANKQTASDG